MRPEVSVWRHDKKVDVLHFSLCSLLEKTIISNVRVRVKPKYKPKG